MHDITAVLSKVLGSNNNYKCEQHALQLSRPIAADNMKGMIGAPGGKRQA